MPFDRRSLEANLDSFILACMNRGSIDLTTEEIERLAAEVWDVAAKEALAKGLPVTVYHDGRLFRYHPARGIEDLTSACIDAEAATTQIDGDTQSCEAVGPHATCSDDRHLDAAPVPDVADGCEALASASDTAEPSRLHAAGDHATATSAAAAAHANES